MKKLLLISSIFFIVLGCKKTKTSYWQIGDESFSSDKVKYSYSPGGGVLTNDSHENGFSIMLIPGGPLPQSGSVNINPPGPGSGGAHVTFYYHGHEYNSLAKLGTGINVQFSATDGKAVLTIAPNWFRKLELDSNSEPIFVGDSVLIQGKFSEP